MELNWSVLTIYKIPARRLHLLSYSAVYKSQSIGIMYKRKCQCKSMNEIRYKQHNV